MGMAKEMLDMVSGCDDVGLYHLLGTAARLCTKESITGGCLVWDDGGVCGA